MITFPNSSFLQGIALSSIANPLLKIILLNQCDKAISIASKSFIPLIIFHLLFFLLTLWFWLGGVFFLSLWLFFSLLSLTGSAVLPFPQVPVQEPFLNAHANKRKNVSFRTWQDNEAQRVGRSFAAGTRHPPWGGAKENWSIFNRCKGFWKSPSFLKLYLCWYFIYSCSTWIVTALYFSRVKPSWRIQYSRDGKAPV